MLCERCRENTLPDPETGRVLVAPGDWQRWCSRCQRKARICFACGDLVAKRYYNEHVETSHSRRTVERVKQLAKRSKNSGGPPR